MLRPRVIPSLLLRGSGLVKGVQFRRFKYLGDPINIVRIFNDKEVDELVLLDVTATREGRSPNLERVAGIASECFMPLCYGGGIRSLADMEALFAAGVEKVALNTAAVDVPGIVRAAADSFGSQSVVISIDVGRRWWGQRDVFTRSGSRPTGIDPVAYAHRMQEEGAGEILLTSIDRDGTMRGYDLDLVRQVSSAVSIPVVACGGAGSVADLRRVLVDTGAAAAAAGSLFVFSGPNRAVLVSYPQPSQVTHLIDASRPVSSS